MKRLFLSKEMQLGVEVHRHLVPEKNSFDKNAVDMFFNSVYNPLTMRNIVRFIANITVRLFAFYIINKLSVKHKTPLILWTKLEKGCEG